MTRAIPIEELLAMRAQKQALARGGEGGNAIDLPDLPAGGMPGSLPPIQPSPSFGPPPTSSAPSFPPISGGAGGYTSSAPSFPGAPSGPGTASPSQPGGAQPSGPGAAGASASKLAWVKARWNEATVPQRVLLCLLLPLLAAVWIIFTDDPPPPRRPAASAGSTPAASASSASSADPAATGAGAAPFDALDGGTAENDAGAPPDASSTAEPTATAVASSPPPAPSEPPLPAGKKTLQRQAVDAVAAGSYAEAAKLYEELAKEHPDVSAYAEAARIMRAKADKSK